MAHGTPLETGEALDLLLARDDTVQLDDGDVSDWTGAETWILVAPDGASAVKLAKRDDNWDIVPLDE